MTTHSILAPSSAARRIQCPASVMMEYRYPETEQNPAALEGEAAHWAAFEAFHGRAHAVGHIAPNGTMLTEEMIEGAALYCEDVWTSLAQFNALPDVLRIESPIAIFNIHPESWGTPDAYAWVAQSNGRRPRLLLWDFKFGHRIVDVFENQQIIEYVAGIIAPVLDRGLSDLEIDVTATIVQPRAPHREGPVRRWSFEASELRGHINIATAAAHEALSPNPRTRVGPECRDCRARHACTVLQGAALAGMDMAVASQPFDMGEAAMSLEYRMLLRYVKLMEARASGLEEQLLARGRLGAPLPGLRIEHGVGRERWNVSDAQVIAIGQALGVNVAKPDVALTPKQAVKAGLPSAVLDGIVSRPTGEAKLVEDDGAMARRVFG